MKYEWTKSAEQIEGVIQTLTCEGEMYILEIQEQDNDAVVGTVWRETHATFWEPADQECILEKEYESVAAAKYLLTEFDRSEAEAQARWEDEMDALDQARAEELGA